MNTLKNAHRFSFGKHAGAFNEHISRSIPGYDILVERTCALARRFVQDDTTVLDIGCSEATLLSQLRRRCVASNVQYIGIDDEPAFAACWHAEKEAGAQFRVCDARYFDGYANMSMACSLFTLQFLPPKDKAPILASIFEGLVPGGALLVAEKVLAETGRMQDALTFPYYDFKQANGFTADDILDKERSLRGQMTLWTKPEAERRLREAGFADVQTIWEQFPFVCWIALKH